MAARQYASASRAWSAGPESKNLKLVVDAADDASAVVAKPLVVAESPGYAEFQLWSTVYNWIAA